MLKRYLVVELTATTRDLLIEALAASSKTAEATTLNFAFYVPANTKTPTRKYKCSSLFTIRSSGNDSPTTIRLNLSGL